MHAIGAYLEFRREDKNLTCQFLVAPQMVHPGDKTITIRPSLMHRVVGPEQPRAQWKITLSDAVLEEGVTEEAYMELATTQMGRIISGYTGEEWAMPASKPLYIGISADDAHDIEEMTTPEALTRRIERVRAAAGLPSALWK